MNDFRKEIADAFIKSLEEEGVRWTKKWSSVSQPMNAISGKQYKGINHLWLSYIQMQKGYKDPRWCTFKQATDKGWKIKKGSKSSKVEYWMPWDFKEKKALTWDAYRELMKEEDFEHGRYGIKAKHFSVFNGEQIEGIPPLELNLHRDISQSEIIKWISTNMGVPITHSAGDRAYYVPSEDRIVLPFAEQFIDQYSYNSTALHELSHATGHESRLNRPIHNSFGNDLYAYEELVAEISSAFCGHLIPAERDSIHLDNHKAYIQSWIKGLKDEPDTLFKAIKDAEESADLLETMAQPPKREKEIAFDDCDMEKKEVKMEKLEVILVEPQKAPKVVEIGAELEDMQEVVGGLIQMITPWDDDVALVCNDEGKLIGLPPNRAIYDDNGNIADILVGNFFICYAPIESEDFLPLPLELKEKYMEKFQKPEVFFKTEKGITAVPYEPEYDEIQPVKATNNTLVR